MNGIEENRALGKKGWGVFLINKHLCGGFVAGLGKTSISNIFTLLMMKIKTIISVYNICKREGRDGMSKFN